MKLRPSVWGYIGLLTLLGGCLPVNRAIGPMEERDERVLVTFASRVLSGDSGRIDDPDWPIS